MLRKTLNLIIKCCIIQAGISYTVSDKPTRYLCNAAYYHMLKKNPNAVLIHIPSLKGMSIELMNKLIKVFDYVYSDEKCESYVCYGNYKKATICMLNLPAILRKTNLHISPTIEEHDN